MSAAARTAAVLGGSGFIGHAIVEELLRHGWQVTTVNRGQTPAAYPRPVTRRFGNRTQEAAYARALAAVEAEVVVDVTAYRAAETRLALDAFRGRVRRFLHISTLSVYRWPLPCPVAEDAPLETAPANGYGWHKAACERELAAEPVARLPWTSLRLPAVCGPRDPVGREAALARRLLAGEPVFVPPQSCLCQNLFVRDAARAVRRLLETPAAVGRAYNAGGRPFLLEDYATRLAALLGREPRLVRAAPRALAQSGIDPQSLPYYFTSDLVLDTRRLRHDTGWRPAFGLDRALRVTLEALRRDGLTEPGGGGPS
jgi:nucleoside-diphosphate-sugar epimerase